MSLQHRLADAEERRTAYLAGVQQLFHVPQAVFDQQSAQLAFRAGTERLFQLDHHQLGAALHALEKNIARIAVCHNHIGAAQQCRIGLHIADEIQAALPACLL